MTTKVRIQYFALLRQERGQTSEVVNTDALSPRHLYEELKNRHSFSLKANQLAVAVNDQFASWDQQLKDNDSIVFIPPVAGG